MKEERLKLLSPCFLRLLGCGSMDFLTEISTVRALMMSEMESEYLERDQMQSISLQDELLQHFLREEAVIGTEYNAQLLKTLLAHISSVEVAKFAEKFSTARSCVIKIVEPQVHASLEDLKELVLKVNTLEEEKSIPPWNEELTREGTIGQSPEPGIITDKVEHPGICSTEVIHSDDTLSCCKYTDFLDDQTDRDKVDNIKEQIFELQISLSKLIHELEELEGKLEMHSKSDILLPEISLKKQFKADGSLELDLVLAIAQCHDIFLCPYEVSHMTLRDHLSAPGAKIFRVRVVPGKKIFKDLSEDVSIRHKKYIVPQRRKSLSLEPDLRKMSPLGKFVIAGIIECIFRLHRYGLSLNGKFSLDSFHITASKKVKLDAQLKSLVCCRNPDNMKIDYASIPTVIMQILSLYGDSFPIPFDLQRLLDLLSCEDPVSYEVIIRYNVSLMDEIGKRDHFIILFDRLQQIEKEDEQKGMKNYRLKEVLKYIVAADNDDWRDKLHINSFVEMVRQRHLVDSKKIPDGAMDLLKTWRHNFTHLHEVSNEIQDKDQADILDSIEPGVINQFQQGMHSIMEIDIPHLIKTMKM
ncbi:hypothetical protein SORBI_3006G212600 [Sorghum bicolor]|uniref:Uncharacterized protein n=1 Tax=Sorghum bicolor TaxID=4558 RepID=A0A1B6PN51_SORBI|nr:hypothetical protein SORBI_3006G212600 [Sorghum bicolor]